MTTLIIARHGNTFEAGETPRRVGARTDLPLVAKGREQAQAIGRYLRAQNMLTDVVYSSQLKRTIETAELAIKASNLPQPVYQLAILNEIDYGPDEDKPEEEVIARIGEQAIKDWDEQAKVPEGWAVNPDEIIENWHGFAGQISEHDDNETVLVVTSNGIARFAPYITGNFAGFRSEHDIKISTGSICILKHEHKIWTVKEWNLQPVISD